MKRVCLLFFALVFSPAFDARAQETLLSAGSDWRFRKGTSEASNPVSAWRNAGFNDASWTIAPAPFHYGTNSIGGDDNVYTGTILSDMRGNYTCIFLRRTFVVTNVAEVQSLWLRANVDDGFVAWINGIEVTRTNVSGSQPAYNSGATANLEGSPARIYAPALPPESYLVPGANVIAVQAFNRSLSGSSDFRFDTAIEMTKRPVIVSVDPAPDSVVGSLTQITVVFSKPVFGVDSSDLLANGQLAESVNGGAGATTYIFSFAQPLPGIVEVEWNEPHDIMDESGNPFDGTAPGATWSYTLVDTIAPHITALAPAANVQVSRLTQVEVMFSEPVLGVNAADLLINGQPASSVTGARAGPYLFQFPEPSPGTVQFAWAAGHGITDEAPAPNPFAGGAWTVTLNPGMAVGDVIINEFIASNLSGMKDEDGELQDWIEIYNRGGTAVNLLGWSLTDNRQTQGKWTFPSRMLNPGEYLVVFASGKDRKTPSGTNRFHTNFKLNAIQEYLALFNPELPRVAVTEFAPEYPEQRNDHSFGLDTAGVWRYFATPTPGAANGNSTITGMAPRPHFSVGRGLFDAPFNLVLTAPLEGATIRYTTTGSEPTATTGVLYTSPIEVTNTRVIRAAVFKTGLLPSRTVTRSYIFPAQVLRQPIGPRNYPPDWGTHIAFPDGIIPADYGMDPEIVDDPDYAPLMEESLRSLPAVSIVIDIDDMFGPERGIYSHVAEHQTLYRGPEWERPCSVELIPRPGESGFQVDCGIRMQGNASRNPVKTPKHPFRLFFKGDYGPSRLREQVYPDSPVKSFNTLVLRADFNNSWLHWSPAQRSRGTRIRDGWVKDSWHAMGHAGSHTRYFHLYINGLYWGIYDFGERIDAAFAANYYGGDPDDYDAMASKPTQAIDGDRVAYNAMVSAVRTRDMAVLSNYTAAHQHLDVTNYIDYMLLNFYGGNEDWGFDSNWNAVRRRAPGETYKYIPWDGEQLLTSTSVNRTGNGNVPSGFHTNLVNSAEYRLAFADRIHKHLFNDGALSTPAVTQRWLERASQVELAIIAESARWGDYRRDVHPYSSGPYVLYTRDIHWRAEIDRVTGNYFPQRRGVFLNQARNAGLYPTIDAPSFSQHGGRIPQGFPIVITAPAGTIYYTTNGTDPRVYGTGAVSSQALAYSGTPVVLNATAILKARVLSGGAWSALNEATFQVAELGVPLAITEIMYNPIGGDAYEFIELQNLGTTPLDVSGFSFQGINYVFPDGAIIAPGAMLLLANSANPGAFAIRYPNATVFGAFGGKLSNGGERIAILDRNGQTVIAVHYDDAGGWPTAPDGDGYSLEIIDPRGDPNAPANWRASAVVNGTPGLPPAPPPALGNVVLNEVMAHNVSAVANAGTFPDWVELHNRGDSSVSLENWSLTDNSNPRKFVFPPGTEIAAGAYLVIWCDSATDAPGLHAGFALGRKGETVFLYDDATNRVDAITFGLQLTDYTIGRVGDEWRLTEPTPGAGNVAVALAPPSSVAINEWMAGAGPGAADWLELFNRSSSAPVSLQGLYLGTSNALFQIRSLSFLPPGGYTQFFADELPGADHLEFKLPAAGGAIALHDATGLELERVTYSQQITGVSEGRLPDGGSGIVAFPGSASPGAPNYLLEWDGPVLNEVLARNQRANLAPWNVYADWVELHNPNDVAADLTGLGLNDSSSANSRWIFPSGASIPAGGYLLVWCDGSRPASTSSGDALNTGFSLAGDSGDVYLFNAAGQAVDWVNYGFQLQDISIGRSGGSWRLLASITPGAVNSAPAILGPVTGLRINEWMASPLSGDDWFELYNTGALPVDMGGLFLTDDPSIFGITRSPVAPLSFIGAGRWVKWEADGSVSKGRNHVNFSLNKSGETLRLYNTDFTLIDAVDFGIQADGVSQGRLPDGADHIASFPTTPTPGAANHLPLTNVVINEVLTHTDAPLEDAIELHNPTGSSVNIGGWYLSDAHTDPKRYRIPDGTILPAGGFRVFYQYQFGPADGEVDEPPLFSLNSAHGDAVHLSETDASGNLTGYRASITFGPAANGVSLGRYQTSVGVDFTALSQRTFGVDNPSSLAQFRTGTGLANAGPLVGPVVINEIMYHPSPGPGLADNPNEEFIELHNLSGAPAPLFDPAHPANVWRLADAVRFDFPPNTTIPAGGYLLVVPFNPATDGAALDAFHARYGMHGAIVGPYSGRLDNAGENLELLRPDTPQPAGRPDAGFVPYLLVDRVDYGNAAPWPAAAHGGGASLQRIVSSAYGNDPVNWKAEAPTAGRVNEESPDGPPIIVGQPQDQTVITGGAAEFNVTAASALPLYYQWFFGENPLAGENAAGLTLMNVQPADAGAYRVLVTNSVGSVFSAAAALTVLVPPAILTHPQSETVTAGSNVTLTVAAGGTAPLQYQWQRNNNDLPTRTDATLIIGSASLSDAGSYRAIVTNPAGVAISDPAVVTVQFPPEITSQPQGGLVAAGGSAMLSVTATGDAPLAYQWRINGTNLVNAISAELVLNDLQESDSGNYTVLVSNHAGSALSAVAALIVVSAPTFTQPQILSGGQFTSSLIGAAESVYVIDVSTNLTAWFELTTVTNTTGVTPFADPGATNSIQRYYRARIAP